jgi:hypothetical protein
MTTSEEIIKNTKISTIILRRVFNANAIDLGIILRGGHRTVDYNVVRCVVFRLIHSQYVSRLICSQYGG